VVHGDGTKLASDKRNDTTKIHNLIKIYGIADRAAKHQNVTHEYAYLARHQGWIVDGPGQLEYREALCLAQAETIRGRPIKVDFGAELTECIDQEWLKELKERGMNLLRYGLTTHNRILAYA